MATMRDIVERAGREALNLRAGDPLEDEDFADILQALNEFLGGLKAKGVNIQHTADLDESATFPLAYELEGSMRDVLKERIAEMFDETVTLRMQKAAQEGRNAINAAYRLPDDMHVDRGLANMPSQRRVC